MWRLQLRSKQYRIAGMNVEYFSPLKSCWKQLPSMSAYVSCYSASIMQLRLVHTVGSLFVIAFLQQPRQNLMKTQESQGPSTS